MPTLDWLNPDFIAKLSAGRTLFGWVLMEREGKSMSQQLDALFA